MKRSAITYEISRDNLVDPSVPPWEQPGGFRLDCEPHRSDLLYRLGICAVILGVLSLYAWPLAVVNLPLSLTLLLLAGKDLARMRKGVMDPGGECRATLARGYGLAGLICSTISLVGWGSLMFFAFLKGRLF